MGRGRKLIDLTGQKFGRLVVIKRAENDKCRNTMWLCRCDCGNEVEVRPASLKDGLTQSCGCLVKDSTKERSSIHGMYNTRLYSCWKAMKARCYNKNNLRYSHYGGRGITICNEWLNSFEVFKDWALANGYDDTLTLDRIDRNGNYEPSNCRWATDVEQNNNTSRNHLITYNGETHTVAEWARKLNFSDKALRTRLYTGWPVEKALTTPVKCRRRSF